MTPFKTVVLIVYYKAREIYCGEYANDECLEYHVNY